MISSEVTFQTSVGSETEDPVFQRGAVFIYAYQAVTSESESKVRLFSPFPQPPAFDPAGALRLRKIVLEARQNLSNTGQKYQDNIDPTTGKYYSTPMYCVVNTNDMLAKLAGLAESIEYRVNLLLKEQKAIADDHLELLRVAESFAPPPTKSNENKERTGHSRQRRLIPALMAASGAAGLILGNPLKDAACSALSIFKLCSDNKDLKKDISTLMAQQNSFAETMKTVQTANDRKFVFLGSEISKTQENVKAIRDVVENRFAATSRAIDQLTRSLNFFDHCVVHTKHFSNLVFKVENYTSYLDLVFTHLKAYRSAFVSYRTNLYSAVSSLSSGYVTPNFLTPNRLAEIVHELTMEEVHRGTKLTPAIQVGYEATYYEVQIVLEVSILASGISVVLGIPMNSKSATFNILRAIPLYQPNEDGSTASLYQFRHDYLAIATDKSQYAELSVATLQQCSGTNRIKLCRKGFSTTTDVTLLCLTSLFYNFSVPALRNCHVESVLLPDAPQAFYLADGLYHVISRTRHLPMMNDTHSHGTRMSTIDCQACVIRPGCSSKLTLNHGDLVLNPDMDYCETRPEPFVAKVQLTPSLQKVFESLPPPSAEFNMYSHSEVRKSVLTSVRMELAELPEVHTMDFDRLKEVAEPISHYYASIPPATSKALEGYMQTKSALCLALLSMTISLISFSISFTLFRRQWKQFITHPQRFFRGTHGRFLHIVNELAADDTQATTAFLYLTEDEFSALSELAKEVLARRKVATCSTSNPSTEQPLLYPDVTHTYSTPNA